MKQIVTINLNHICPMVTGVTPHIGGPIIGPGCPGVMVNGVPISVMGDMCVCCGPPDTIVQGEPGILVNGKPIVLQGCMTAHGGIIPAGVPGVTVSSASPIEPITMNHVSPKRNRFLAAISGNNLQEAIENQNALQKKMLEEEPMIFNVHWEKEDIHIAESHINKKVTVNADTIGFKDGETVKFVITPEAIDTANGEQVEDIELTGTVNNNHVTVEWIVELKNEKMKDDMIAIFGLKASGKGKEAQGNNLYAVDYVRLYLSLYGVYSKSTHKSGILAPLEGNDVSSFPAPKGFPDMKYGYSYQRIPLRKGYIYAYFEKHNTAGIFKEYEVTNEGGIVNLVWSDMENPRISWETPKKDRMTNYIVLRKQYDKKVWLVFSPIRWSKQYAEKVLGNEEERNKRMQSLECETCFKGEYDNHGFAVEEAKSILVSPPWDYLTEFSDKVKAGNYLEWENASYKAYFDRYKGQYEKNCALKKGDADNHDFYFSLFDPQGIADILCADIAIETRNLLVMVESMKTGDITKAYKKVDANALDGNYDNPELVALIDMGILLYRMSDVKTGVFTKYKSHISTDLLKTILLVEPRAKLRQKIHYIRELLSEIIMCEAYQLSIQDYLVEKMPTVNKGKSSLSKHLSGLANAPEKIDGYLDQPIGHSKNLSVTEKKIGNCINNVLSSESNTGKLLRKEWNLDEIVDSVSLITDTQDSVGDIADALLGYIRYIRANQKLNFISEVFRFVTKDGQIFVKIPEGMFTAELKNKIDFHTYVQQH
ncbi:toxin VasX [Bacteroides fragilis]